MSERSQFAEYVRSSSFRIDLTSAQIRNLYVLHEYPYDEEEESRDAIHVFGYCCSSYNALVKKGVAYHVMGKGYFISEEGKLVFQLLKLAGFYDNIDWKVKHPERAQEYGITLPHGIS